MVKALAVDETVLAALTPQQYATTMIKFRKKAAIEIEKSTTVGQRTVLEGQGVRPSMTTSFVFKYLASVIAIMMATARENRRETKRCIIFRMRMSFLSFYVLLPDGLALSLMGETILGST
jgi:hypothetical protein